MKLVFEPVFNLSIPRRGSMRLRPEIFDRIGAAEFQWNQVVNLVIAGAVRDAQEFEYPECLVLQRRAVPKRGSSTNSWISMAADFSGAASFNSSSEITTKLSRSTSKPRTISSAGTSLPVASETR